MKKLIARMEAGEMVAVEIDGTEDIGNAGIKILLSNGEDWIVFRNHDEAGEAARAEWVRMINDGPEAFIINIGPDVIMKWLQGEEATTAPGRTADNLQDWLETVRATPAQEFAMDGAEVPAGRWRWSKAAVRYIAEEIGEWNPTNAAMYHNE